MSNTTKIVNNIVRFIIIFASIILTISMYFLLSTQPSNVIKVNKGDKVEIGGQFTLINQDGELFDSLKFDKQYKLIYFGFTYCPDICPDSLQKITALLDSLESYKIDILPIFITIDPERDTPNALKEYIKNFHHKFIALTGSTEQIQTVAKLFKVYYQMAPEKENSKDYMIDHSAFLYLMDKEGNYVAHFDTSEKSDIISYKLIKLLKEKNAL